jgi:gluconokinase
MAARRYVVGVDIGTTSTKAVLYADDGQVCAQHDIGYPLYTPTPFTAEQDPDEIFRAVLTTIAQIVSTSGISRNAVAAVCFSSAMHSVIAIDGQGLPLTRCITWADNRSAKWASRIKAEGGHQIYLRTGTPIHPMAPLAKLRWLREEDPDLFRRAARFVGIKEYVFHRLFDRYLIDHSIASATGLLNLRELDWDSEALGIAGIGRERLSELVPTTFVVRGLNPDLLSETQLTADVPFVVGASDGVLSNLGLNAIDPGVFGVTIGTSAAVRAAAENPATDSGARTFCYALTDKLWVIGGASNNGAVVLSWLRDLFGPEAPQQSSSDRHDYDRLIELAKRAPPGAEGLLFHPYLSGERSPLWNADARGSFFGLGLRHKRGHLIRAALEGVFFNLRAVMLAVESLVGAPRMIHATGGFARSVFWRQMLADVFGQEVFVPKNVESSCLGAAVLGLYALGMIDSLSAVSGMIGEMQRYTPNAETAAQYERLMPVFLDLVPKLSEGYAAVSELQRQRLDTN